MMDDDLISRKAAIDAARKCSVKEVTPNYMLIDKAEIMTELMMLPSAEPERKTGRWIESNPQNSEICRLINCSECGKGYIVNINVPYEDWTDAHKFCVECGAKMEVEDENTLSMQ